ncbi:hypothetical protein [uncultured Secundilactobacillus sp.]|uniref:hypothetical protein n=1 Tax=uncultured Secundilactobacillus sp. TaxID=2813935 RepID=UPI00258FD207|nr:hypothetical protein [uncultured Secundilactobacillus sp.]
MNNLLPMHPDNPFPDSDKVKKKQTFDGHEFNGGGDMRNEDKYVTHAELNNAIDKLSAKMDLMEAHIDNKFEQINTKFEAINTKFADQENKQIKWFLGTAVAIIGLTVSLIKFL